MRAKVKIVGGGIHPQALGTLIRCFIMNQTPMATVELNDGRVACVAEYHLQYLKPYGERQADLAKNEGASERARRLDLFTATALTGLIIAGKELLPGYVVAQGEEIMDAVDLRIAEIYKLEAKQ